MQHSIKDYAIAWVDTSRFFFNEFTDSIKNDFVFAPSLCVHDIQVCISFKWHDTVDICSMNI